jgi:hypothetical protein
MIHIKDYELFEKKMVGIIYHFTTPAAALDILRQDMMQSQLGHISFTRNPDLKSWYEDYDSYVRFAFNGSDMSDKFKIEPHLYKPPKFDPLQDIELFKDEMPKMSYKERLQLFKDEREETIKKPEIFGIKKYMIQIDILSQYRTGSYEKIKNSLSELTEVPVNIVDKFKPIKGLYV